MNVIGNLIELRRIVTNVDGKDTWVYVEREGLFEHGINVTNEWAIRAIENGKFVFSEMTKRPFVTTYIYIPAW